MGITNKEEFKEWLKESSLYDSIYFLDCCRYEYDGEYFDSSDKHIFRTIERGGITSEEVDSITNKTHKIAQRLYKKLNSNARYSFFLEKYYYNK